MKQIVNLMKLDFITMKGKSLISLIGMILVTFAGSLFSMGHFAVITLTFAGLSAQPLFTVAEKCGYNKLYGTLPIKKSQYIRARFIYTYTLLISVAAIVILLGHISLKLSFGENFKNWSDFAYIAKEWQKEGFTIGIMAALLIVVGCFLTAMNFCILFIFGIAKEIPMSILFQMVLVAIIVMLVKTKVLTYDIIFKLAEFISKSPAFACMTFYLLGAAIMAVGAEICCLVMRKGSFKESTNKSRLTAQYTFCLHVFCNLRT